MNQRGSMRAAALIRIGLVLLIWARLGPFFTLHQQSTLGGVFLSVSLGVASLLMLVGLYSSMAVPWMALNMGVIYFYLGFYLGHEPLTHHHVYLLFIAVALLSFSPSGRDLSLDSWRSSKKEGSTVYLDSRNGSLLGLYLIRIQLSAMYLWTVFDKFSWQFLSGERLEQILRHRYLGSDYFFGAQGPIWQLFPKLCCLAAVLTVLLELFLGFAFWFKSLRWYALAAGVFFHLLLFWLLPVATFSLTVCLLYLAFFNDLFERDRN